MDCRKWLLLAASLMVSAAGCVTQHHDALSDKTTTTWFPLSLFKSDKRTPSVETCLAGGKSLEEKALSPKISAREKEEYLDRSRKAYQQALSIERDNPQAFAGLARVYVHLKDFDRAHATYDKALKKHPKNGDLWFELGKCHCRQKNYDPGTSAFRKAWEADPENRQFARHLGLCLARSGNHQEAVKVLGKLHGEAQANYEVALMLKSLNQPEEALTFAQKALQRDPMLIPAQHLVTQLSPDAEPVVPAFIPPDAEPISAPAHQQAIHLSPQTPEPSQTPKANLGFQVD